MGDSLAGCFFSFRLHPLDLREICQLYKKQAPDEILDRLLKVSGFPEPYFRGSQSFYNRWQKTHTEVFYRRICWNWIGIIGFLNFKLY